MAAFKRNGWLASTGIGGRFGPEYSMLAEKGVLFVSIDKHERTTVEFALNAAFGVGNKVEELIWIQNTNDGRSPTYSVNHEYVEVYARNKTAVELDPRIFREPKPGAVEVFELIQRLNPKYPSIAQIQDGLKQLYANHRKVLKAEIEAEGLNWSEEKRNNPWKGVYMYKFSEYRDENGNLVTEEHASSRGAHIWVYRESDWTIMSSSRKQSDTTKDPNNPNYRFYIPNHPLTGKPISMPTRGWKGRQFVDPEHPNRNTWESLAADDRIAIGPDESKVPQQKRMLHEVETNVAKTIFRDYNDGERETLDLFGRTGVFLAPKHSTFVRRFLDQVVLTDSLVLDCFAGSGSTAHAVQRINRDNNHHLRYVLVELGEYFDEILVPRVLKGAYSSTWKDGKPVDRDGLGQFIRVIRLESYEDALNNLETSRSEPQDQLLFSPEAEGPDGLKEQYFLRYMLDVETRNSQSLLNVQAFADPTAYVLKVKRPGSDESREMNVDLLETFNWLIGLTVEHIRAPRTFSAKFGRDKEKRLRLKKGLQEDAGGPFWFRTVKGTLPDGRRALVIWRKLTGTAEEHNLVLDTWFSEQGFFDGNSTFDLVYVNGGNNLENLKAPGDLWKARLIEDDFHRLMFDTSDA